jgi:hypothetical protein
MIEFTYNKKAPELSEASINKIDMSLLFAF